MDFTKILATVIVSVLIAFTSLYAYQDRPYLKRTIELQQTLIYVNSYWNSNITYKKDKEVYNLVDYWTFPKDKVGDCEDFATAKKKDLDKRGISGYYVTCLTETGRKHVVLFVFTDSGAFVLDNRTDKVMLASRSRYRWLKIQFPNDIWVDYNTGEITEPPRGYLKMKKGKINE